MDTRGHQLSPAYNGRHFFLVVNIFPIKRGYFYHSSTADNSEAKLSVTSPMTNQCNDIREILNIIYSSDQPHTTTTSYRVLVNIRLLRYLRPPPQSVDKGRSQ